MSEGHTATCQPGSDSSVGRSGGQVRGSTGARMGVTLAYWASRAREVTGKEFRISIAVCLASVEAGDQNTDAINSSERRGRPVDD